MPRRKSNPQPTPTTAATVGYEAELWELADALRGSMDAVECKHVGLGLIGAQAKGNCNGGKANIALYGQESNYITWRFAEMNLAITARDKRGQPSQPSPRPGGHPTPSG